MPRKKKADKVEPKKKLVASPHQESQKKEDVVEYFDVEKDGKEKIIEAKGKEIVEQKPNKNQITNENRLLRNVLIALGILMLVFLATYFLINSSKNFEFKGVGYSVVNDNGGIAPYKTSLPVDYNGTKATYNFYLRNDPRKNDVIFSGNIAPKKDLVIDSTDNFICNSGDVYIAVENLRRLYERFGTNMMKNESLKCSPSGEYMYLNVINGTENKIKQYGPSCYELTVNNCEVIKVTEKFMIETFAYAKEKVNY